MTDSSVAVRLNTFKRPSGPLSILEGSSPVPWSPHGHILRERPLFTLHPLFHAGCYYVQDSSAMFAGYQFRRALDSLEGISCPRVLDLCAAPGGKTTDLAASLRERFGDSFVLVSNEVMKDRSRILLDNVARWGDPNVVVTSVDPAAFARMEGYFDIIVADVPCSGEGMFRKDERAREEWSPEVVDLCAKRQKRILADVWPALRDGGVLVYSTCTYEDAENDNNLRWAAETLGGEIIAPEDRFSDYGVVLTSCGSLLRAGMVPGEGQWVGSMRKNGGSQRRDADVTILRPLRNGVVRGETKGKDFVPSADWALSIDFDRSIYPEAALDKQTALHYLHRDTIVLPDAPLGYNVVTYKGIVLGFVKNLGRRCNNMHPAARRIIMDIK